MVREGVSNFPSVPPPSTIAASGDRSRLRSMPARGGAPASSASSTPITCTGWKRPFGKRRSTLPSASAVAERTPATPRTRSSAESGRLMVCSTESTAGSITHTSACGFSDTSEKPWVMNPQKYDAAKVTRKEVKAIPNSRPKNLARSAASIASAIRIMAALAPTPTQARARAPAPAAWCRAGSRCTRPGVGPGRPATPRAQSCRPPAGRAGRCALWPDR